VAVFTIGHGTRTAAALVACLSEAGVATLVDVRRDALAATLAEAGLRPRARARRTPHRGTGRGAFTCIRERGFRSYAALISRPEWQEALAAALAQPAPCFMCSETPWQRCHRRLIAELLAARDVDVVHLIRPRAHEHHRSSYEAEYRSGKLFLCGHFVA
jgi:uncharacterized protein (DUF488 family)